ncbi:calcium channel flower homolog [Ciona intestinalis]
MVNTPDIESQERNKGDGITWWCKLFARGVGVVAAIICAICAITTFLSGTFGLDGLCITAAVLMILNSFILLMFEAPICCAFCEITQPISNWVEKRQYWQKGLLYIGFSILPVALCRSIATILGCVCPFAAGVIYGLMSLGKKADRNEMLANAGGGFEKFENESGS